MNPDHNFTSELLKKTLNLKCHSQNIIIKTRQQKRLDTIRESTLDFFSTHQIQSLEKLEKLESDHYPIMAEIRITGKIRKRKKLIAIRQTVINEDSINNFITNTDWTTQFDIESKGQLMKKLMIRPTIKLQNTSNKIFEQK